jgi:hypothetical protein
MLKRVSLFPAEVVPCRAATVKFGQIQVFQSCKTGVSLFERQSIVLLG